MKVVYPLLTQLDHTELKYSLRSLDKFMIGSFEVVIVGNQVPDWITNVTQIKVNDVSGRTQLSVRRKILAAVEYVKDDLFYMNDDFFLMKQTDPLTYPYYSTGTMNKIGESGAAPLVKQLTEIGKPIKYFGHYPCIIKQDFKEVLQNFTAECINKSAYCNFISAGTIEIPDCKLKEKTRIEVVRAFVKDKPCLSTGPASLKSALPLLEELFPEPSQFET